MSELMVAVSYTRSSSALPATGLVLAEIDLYLTAVNRVTGATTVVWDGTQNPTVEVDNVGFYARIYAGADLDTYNYFAGGMYTGAVVLDADWVAGAVGLNTLPIGTAAERDYKTVESDLTPIQGVRVDISTDLAGTNIIWSGDSDALGFIRDDFNNKPRLNNGTYYMWRYKAGYIFDNPDTEVFT